MRRTLWKWHGWLGLTAALPLFIIALTGSLLVFKAELEHLIIPEVVSAAADTRQPFNQLISSVDNALSEHEILGWEFATTAGSADKLYVAKQGSYDWQLMFVDPSNGELLSPPVSLTHYFMDWLLELHYTLLADHVGLVFTAIISILLILLSISGFILHRQFWKTFFTLRWHKSLRLLLSDIHKMLGIIGAPLFLLLGFTGAWWNIEHVLEEFDAPDQSQFNITQQYYNPTLDFNHMLLSAQTSIAHFNTRYIRFPDKSYPGIHLFGASADKGLLRSDFGSIISFDDQTGVQTSVLEVSTAPALYQFVDSFKPLHYGTFGGLISKVLWSIIGFFPCLMAISGFIMWRKRQRPNKK